MKVILFYYHTQNTFEILTADQRQYHQATIDLIKGMMAGTKDNLKSIAAPIFLGEFSNWASALKYVNDTFEGLEINWHEKNKAVNE